jgi:hypothetical protein
VKREAGWKVCTQTKIAAAEALRVTIFAFLFILLKNEFNAYNYREKPEFAPIEFIYPFIGPNPGNHLLENNPVFTMKTGI